MFQNYFKVAFRNLWKNKSFTAINMIGLASGLAVCLLITLYVFDEISYDKYNTNADRIYRIDADILFNGTGFNAANAPEPLPPTLLRECPQVQQMVRFSNQGDIAIKKGNNVIIDHHAVFADSTLFQVFTLPMVAGNPATALREPNSLVIDETTAKKYFGSTNVLGKTLYVESNAANCKITGVIKDMPQQSHFHFHFIRSFMDTYRGNADNWLSNNNQSYILVKPGVTQAFIQSRVDAIVNNYISKQLEAVLHASLKDFESQGNHFHYPLMPLTSIHLHSDKSYEFEVNGNINYVYIFSVIGIFILLIACVNFMNLSTARSANRAKEVGIRKVAGSLRSHLILQFLTESVLLSFFSLVIAIVLAVLLLPLFNQFAGKEMQTSALFASWMLPTLVVLVFIVGCIAGSYPAFYLSAFQPIQVLKGRLAQGFKSSWLRSSLVVFQFSISIILIIGTIVIYNQLSYMKSRKIGYNRDEVMVLRNAWPLNKQVKSFREELLKIPGVQSASITANLPTDAGFDKNGWFRDANFSPSNAVIVTDFYTDENYIPTLGMNIVAGRNFSKNFASDSAGIIINEAAVKALGLKEPMQAKLYRPNGNNEPVAFHVIGVVKDFNFSSMHETVGPLIMELANVPANIVLRVNTSHISAAVNTIEKKWNAFVPGQPFMYSFMDADFNNIYNQEQRMGKLFISFAAFAIFIACLGLFGLVTYAAEQRRKEIGIRKVLGARVGGIVTMLSKDFAKLVVIAAVIAFPVAWWAMSKWLQSFAYRTNIGWWVFIMAGVVAISIALITVSFQAIKAAVANPVKSLRSE